MPTSSASPLPAPSGLPSAPLKSFSKSLKIWALGVFDMCRFSVVCLGLLFSQTELLSTRNYLPMPLSITRLSPGNFTLDPALPSPFFLPSLTSPERPLLLFLDNRNGAKETCELPWLMIYKPMSDHVEVRLILLQWHQ